MRLALLAALLASAVACTKKEAPPPSDAAPATPTPTPTPTPGPVALRFLVASPRVTKAPRPPRYDAALPTSAAALAAEAAFPPAEYLRLRLDAGDAEARKRVLAGLERAAKAGPLAEELARYYRSVFGYYSTSPKTCAFLAGALGTASAPARAALYTALSRCADATLAPHFTRAEAPDEAVIDWYFELHEGTTPFNPRFVAAARRRAKAAHDVDELRPVGFGFARMEGPVVKELEALLREVEDPHRRAVLSLGMLRHPSPEGRALGEKACAHPTVRNDAMCSEFRPKEEDPLAGLGFERPQPLPDRPGPDAGLDEVVAYFGAADDEVLARFGPRVFGATLERCARTEERRAALCLHRLARLDRGRALAFARGPGGALARKEPGTAVVVRTLERYPDGGLHGRLVDAGVLGPADADTEGTWLTAEDLLLAADRLSRFDVETGTFPNAHHELLFELAALADAALAGVLFEEVPPPEEEMDTGPYRLVAFMDGRRFEVTAENFGDWYDTGAVLGLLNALLVERKSELRYLTLPTGDQTAAVVVAPRGALEALAREGLLDVAGADEGMKAGKAFEDEVFRRLGGRED